MQFLILAHDAKDEGALKRRMESRTAHIATIDRYKASGNMHIGAAILDDAGNMCGSVIIAEFPSREALDGWLKEEPYVVNKVWGDVKVRACKLGPTFANKS